MTPIKRALSVVAGVAVATGAVFTGVVAASPSDGPALSNVPTANTKSDGYAPASKLSPELTQRAVAQGSTRLENPSALTSYYGYFNDVLNAAGQPQMLPTPASQTEAQKSEPDKNTYLVFKRGLSGADSSYNYGTHFLFQGHELGVGGASYLTRINLDADAAHRVTLLATTDTDGQPIAPIDGSTWDPWARRLLFTTENENAPTYAATPGFPSTVTDVSGALGRGGYEGIQNDSAGNIWMVEDIGGPFKAGTKAKQPNSFVYRYVPARPGDLQHGKLQALQVLNSAGDPITFDSQAALNNPDQVALHTYGNTFKTRWVTVHDTATAGNSPFDANVAAKAAHATPFKRPENGLFQPGSRFTTFFFDETGDTDATSPENASAGGWGSIMKFTQGSPRADTGTLTMFYKSDGPHSSLDNVAFLSRNVVTFVQDMGDTLHTQLNALDSGYTWNTTTNYANPANQPVRWLAQGRDASATIDSAFGGFGKNEGDNEITGAHVSNGDPSVGGILGARVPNLNNPGWRWFYTQQHGDNTTYEVTPMGR
ncbi:MAG: phosphatase [Actinobacteria bacterium]|nr:phosphatase [Actinomycetota bacterium]